MNRVILANYLEGFEVSLMIPDGYDRAILGLLFSPLSDSYQAVYGIETMIDILVERDGMSPEEAFEFIDYNVFGFGSDDCIYIWEDIDFAVDELTYVQDLQGKSIVYMPETLEQCIFIDIRQELED